MADQIAELEGQVSELTRELSSRRQALAACEGRLHAADGREAQLMAELREMDLVIAEREKLGAEVVALREKLVGSCHAGWFRGPGGAESSRARWHP